MNHPWLLLKAGLKGALERSGDLTKYAGVRIHHFQAPPGQALDAVEFRRTAGGTTNESPRAAFNVTVEVYGISLDEGRADAMAEAIRDAMTSGGIRMVGWDVYDVDERDWIDRRFYVDGAQYWAKGQVYDVRGAKRG